MQTLWIQYQIGRLAPSWYPLYSDVTLSPEVIAEQLKARGSAAFRTILQHKIFDDGKTQEQADAEDEAVERAESNRCDAGYIHDVRFGSDDSDR